MRLTPANIRALVDEKVFARGMEYYADGKVIDCALKDGVLLAHVQGSLTVPYAVNVRFAGRQQPHVTCTCPYAREKLCKHGVAVLLYISRGPAVAPKVPLARQRKALLFAPDEEQIPPVLRLLLPTRDNFKVSAKGITTSLHLIEGKRATAIRSVESLLASRQPFNPAQQYCLRLMATFWREAGSGMTKLQPFELSLLLREAAGATGIEFFEGKHHALHIRPENKVAVTIEVGYKNLKATQANFITKHPDGSGRVLEGALITGRPCWLIDFQSGDIFPFDDAFDQYLLTDVFAVNDAIDFSRPEFPAFAGTVLNRIKGHSTIIYRDKELEQVNVITTPPVIQLYIDGDADELTIELKCTYDQQVFTLNDLLNASEYMPAATDASTWIKRNIAQEKKAIRVLCDEGGFKVDAKGILFLSDTATIAQFVFHQLPTLAGQYQIYYAGGFEQRFKSKAVLKPFVHLGAEGLDWFHFDVRYRAEGINEEFSQEDIRRQLTQGKHYIQLKSGEILPIAVDQFTDMQGLVNEFEGKTTQLPAFHLPLLLEEIARKGVAITQDGSFQQLHDKLQEFRSITPVEPPPSLKPILRDYQQKGLDWLEFLRGFKFGGILADEMGLGKTLQVLALLKNMVDAGEKMPSLIVCPTTLVWNWQAEVQKFAPDLKVIVPQGPERRSQIAGIKDCHLVITSYALLRRDAAFYEKLAFNYVVLDEAQNIKNRNTLNARMSKKIKSRYRLVMTGTPLENSIADLWSIFDFLMPGFLGGYDRFQKRYELPILRDQSQPALEALARKIKPFMLRRLKAEVIKELPARIEQVGYCELEPTQYKCYEQMLKLARKEVTDAYQRTGFNKNRMKILTVILRLRQICCHPELANVTLGHRLSVSAKLNLLKEMLQEALSGGHKVLIFSQFIGMLEIIAQYLKKEGIVFEYMDGSTTDRRETVDRFNADAKVRVFLLSLKVGGVGLNLTSADTVILFEPWWNPAVEDQAIDRAHRIGQQKTVMAYKLICKGTIEEKILELQKRKKNMIDSLIIAEEGIAKKLDWEDIRFLLGIE